MEKRKILVVEDDVSINKMLKINLEASGYEVIVASNGKEAMQMAHQEKPELIVLDVMLPDEDGFSVIEKIKNSQDIAYTPIVVMSAHPTEEIKRKIPSYASKSTGSRTLLFIKKPFEIEEFLDEIENIFRRKTD